MGASAYYSMCQREEPSVCSYVFLTLQTITLSRIRPVAAEVMTLVSRRVQDLPGVVSSPVLMAATIPLSRVLLLLGLCSSSADPVTLLKTPLV